MADFIPIMETLEHRWMRAWVGRDLKTLKSLTSRKFMLLVGSKPSAILDARSFFEAVEGRYQCSSYRFGDIYARDLGSVALFATQAELKATMDGEDWSGRYWVTDLWQKSRVRRSWRMVERIISRTDDNPKVPAAIRSLQLWK